jgi:hypothetical protein
MRCGSCLVSCVFYLGTFRFNLTRSDNVSNSPTKKCFVSGRGNQMTECTVVAAVLHGNMPREPQRHTLLSSCGPLRFEGRPLGASLDGHHDNHEHMEWMGRRVHAPTGPFHNHGIGEVDYGTNSWRLDATRGSSIRPLEMKRASCIIS